jgi:hypothetical protein
VKAAPDHVESVRSHLIDPLNAKEFSALGAACAKVAAALGDLPGLTGQG